VQGVIEMRDVELWEKLLLTGFSNSATMLFLNRV